MAVTQAHLDRLIEAKLSGVMEVEQDGKKVRYQTMAALDAAIVYAQRALGQSAAQSRTSYADFS
jgi:hypothetical protein